MQAALTRLLHTKIQKSMRVAAIQTVASAKATATRITSAKITTRGSSAGDFAS
jgi:hypothetical protein